MKPENKMKIQEAKLVNICYPGEDLWTFYLEVENLEDIFVQFNHGSGKECEDFVDQRMRSLSVGDFVQLDSQWWECRPIGWEMVKSNYVIGQCCARGVWEPDLR
tara:strand:+ start:447 stop:758 length:312 start_codon:yes stop_codon:yes gene_type:complete